MDEYQKGYSDAQHLIAQKICEAGFNGVSFIHRMGTGGFCYRTHK